MRKLLLILSAAFFAGSAHAQLHSHSAAYVGLKVGGSAATFVGDVAPNLQYVYGLHGGVFANLPLMGPFSVQPELLYSMKGMQDPAYYVKVSSVWLNYVDVPVAFRASTGGGLFAELGPQVGILINAKSDIYGEKMNVKSAYSSVDIGYLLGVGYQPAKGGLGIGARYNAGFSSVSVAPIDGSEASDQRNSVFQVYLTYSKSKFHKPTKRKQ